MLIFQNNKNETIRIKNHKKIRFKKRNCNNIKIRNLRVRKTIYKKLKWGDDK